MDEKTGVELILQERERQISEEKWSDEHDDQHDEEELALAACCYAAPEDIYIFGSRQVQVNSSRGLEDAGYFYDYKTVEDYHDPWPWDEDWDKREKHDRIKRLTIAGALIAAEIDRLRRLEDNG